MPGRRRSLDARRRRARRGPPLGRPSRRSCRPTSRRRRSPRSATDRRVSYDGQGLVRCAELGPVRFDGEFDRDVLTHISFLKLAEEEAAAFMPRVTDEAIFRLGVPEVVVTLGSRGSIVYAGGASTPIPCRPIHGVDLTGLRRRVRRRLPRGARRGLGPVAAARRATALVALLLTNRRRGARGELAARDDDGGAADLDPLDRIGEPSTRA